MVGRVESVAVGAGRPDPVTRVESGLTGIDKRPVGGPVRISVDGVAGDTICDLTHHGGPDQAVYAYAAEDLAYWSAALGRPVSSVGQNLTLLGVDCTGAVVGERWRVGTALLVVRAPRIPCRVFAGFVDVPDMVRRFTVARRPGCYLAVVEEGWITAGDTVNVLTQPAHGVTVSDVMAAMSGERELLDRLRRAEGDLAARVQKWLVGVGGRG